MLVGFAYQREGNEVGLKLKLTAILDHFYTSLTMAYLVNNSETLSTSAASTAHPIIPANKLLLTHPHRFLTIKQISALQ